MCYRLGRCVDFTLAFRWKYRGNKTLAPVHKYPCRQLQDTTEKHARLQKRSIENYAVYLAKERAKKKSTHLCSGEISRKKQRSCGFKSIYTQVSLIRMQMRGSPHDWLVRRPCASRQRPSTGDNDDDEDFREVGTRLLSIQISKDVS